MVQGLLPVLCSPGYRLPGPVEGGMGPRQWPFTAVTGWSSLGHHTVNSPLVRRTSTNKAFHAVSLRGTSPGSCQEDRWGW